MNDEYIDVNGIVNKIKKMDKDELYKYILEKISHTSEFAINFIDLLDDEKIKHKKYKMAKKTLNMYY